MPSRPALRLLLLLLACLPTARAGQAAEGLPGPVEARLVRVADPTTLVVDAHPWPGVTIRTALTMAGAMAPQQEETARLAVASVGAAAALAGGRLWLRDLRPEAQGLTARVYTADGRDLANVANGETRRSD